MPPPPLAGRDEEVGDAQPERVNDDAYVAAGKAVN
jgi:hypothetical protein